MDNSTDHRRSTADTVNSFSLPEEYHDASSVLDDTEGTPRAGVTQRSKTPANGQHHPAGNPEASNHLEAIERRRLNLVASVGNLIKQRDREEPMGSMNAPIEAFIAQSLNEPRLSGPQDESTLGNISISRPPESPPAEHDDKPRQRPPIWGLGLNPSGGGYHLQPPPTFVRPTAAVPDNIHRTRIVSDTDHSLPRSSSLQPREPFGIAEEVYDDDDGDYYSDGIEAANVPHIASVQRPEYIDQTKTSENIALSKAIQHRPDFPMNAEIRNVGRIQKLGETDMHILDNGEHLGGLACKECRKIMKVIEVSGVGLVVCDMAKCLNCDGERPVVIGIDGENNQATCFDCTQNLKDELDLLFCPNCMLRDRERHRASEYGRQSVVLQSVMRNKPLPQTPEQSKRNPFESEPDSPKPKTALKKDFSSILLGSMGKSNDKTEASGVVKLSQNTETSNNIKQRPQLIPKPGKKMNKVKRFFNLNEQEEDESYGDEGTENQSSRLRANTAIMDVGGSAAFPIRFR
ncbi:MAG: hypothetical protein M1831_003047 [Alyxoria varia]|nr:MAG: hypothetical protein M1831_003047 [Alyxoria varia]